MSNADWLLRWMWRGLLFYWLLKYAGCAAFIPLLIFSTLAFLRWLRDEPGERTS